MTKLIYVLFFFPGAVFAGTLALESIDYSGYLRAGSGTNLHGGEQECFYNRGSVGNEFRLGNECGIYSELVTTLNTKKSAVADPSFFKTQIRLAFFPENYRTVDRIPPVGASDVNKSFDNRGVNLSEMFVEGGNFAEFPYAVWIGKRFYRQVDAHMDDWFYFGDMSGAGAGIGQTEKDHSWALAHLFQGTDTRTDRGLPVTQAADFRYDWGLDSDREFHLWSAFGWAAAGANTANTIQYQAARGELLGLRIHQKREGGFTDGALVYGYGLMSSLGLNTVNPTPNDYVNKAQTWRAVLQDATDKFHSWGLLTVIAAESRNSGAPTNPQSDWQTVGIRPVWIISDHKQLAFEAGFSRVKDDSEFDPQGNSLGWRNLTRLTIAPQLSWKRGIWSRPVMRVFYTRSFWNDANKTNVAVAAPSFAGDKEGSTFGYQVETWF